jgi:hypothetical protein
MLSLMKRKILFYLYSIAAQASNEKKTKQKSIFTFFMKKRQRVSHLTQIYSIEVRLLDNQTNKELNKTF